MKQIKGGNLSVLIIFLIAFVVLIGAVVIYLVKEENDFNKFRELTKSLKADVERIDQKLEEIKIQNKKLTDAVEAAHDQADCAKSKAEIAENLAHKVAMDAARKITPTTMQPAKIEFEPLRVVISSENGKTKLVKPIEKKNGVKNAITKTKN